MLLPLLVAVLFCDAAVMAGPDRPPKRSSRRRVVFDRDVASLLAGRCLGCHNASLHKGGLDLTKARSARAGGDSGKVIVPSRPDQSYLWQRVRDKEMPPKKPLSPAERTIIKSWIASGAVWGTDPIDSFRFSSDARAGYDWWSLKPLHRPHPPKVRNNAWVRNPIDRFVLSRLEDRGLTPSSSAGRRTLIRRLSFDLLGLPPAPADVDAFVADDAPLAYERLVDRLLASPHYGERWARHWLDIIRFAESQGFERDKLRPNAWRYRDWVVDAFNRDLPYNEFARLQLAGDVLHPRDPSAVIATGFLVAGAYDEVGQNQQSAAMRAVVRQDELEDIVSTIGQTFLGLTVQCARCHDHKFDPIRQVEYYRLTAAIAGVRHGERVLPGQPIPQQERPSRLAGLQARIDGVQNRLSRLEARVRATILARRQHSTAQSVSPAKPVARWEFNTDLNDRINNLPATAHGGARLQKGFLKLDGRAAYAATVPLRHDLTEKTLEVWVQLNNLNQRGGGVMSVQTLDGSVFDAIVFGEREPRQWMAGSNFFIRTGSFHGQRETAAAQRTIHIAVVYRADGTILAYRNGRPYGKAFRKAAAVTFKAGRAQVVFGLRHSPVGGNKLLAGRIDRARLYNRALSPTEIAASAGVPNNTVSVEDLLAQLTPSERDVRSNLLFELEELRREQSRLRATKVYANVPRQPAIAHLLIRGNPARKGRIVAAGGVKALGGTEFDFHLTPNAPESERRLRLTRWISSARNPLFARVIVNRLWHYHFGTGLVDTPNDFGFNGGRPTHPRLIDWLATELIEGRWSLKAIQRSIVLSATYRQASRLRTAAADIDATNRLMWRKSRRRLEAESIRDAILFISGALNPAIGGPGYRDFRTVTRNTQFYVLFDPIGETFDRRSLYRTWVRSGRNRFLDVFDCPDPSTTTPRRAVTTTPLQALSLMNNSLILRMSAKFSERVRRDVGRSPRKQIRRAYRLAFGRLPDAQEETVTRAFVKRHGLAALCRVLFNSNEFLYVN